VTFAVRSCAIIPFEHGTLFRPEAELALSKDHALFAKKSVVTAPPRGRTNEARDREWRLLRENVRRFVAGERLLGVATRGRP
jgi:hypothetical protein